MYKNELELLNNMNMNKMKELIQSRGNLDRDNYFNKWTLNNLSTENE